MKWRQDVKWTMNVGEATAEIKRIPRERWRGYDGRMGTSYVYAWSVVRSCVDGTIEIGRGETEWLPEAKKSCAKLLRDLR